jgi:hypothetical protein
MPLLQKTRERKKDTPNTHVQWQHLKTKKQLGDKTSFFFFFLSKGSLAEISCYPLKLNPN